MISGYITSGMLIEFGFQMRTEAKIPEAKYTGANYLPMVRELEEFYVQIPRKILSVQLKIQNSELILVGCILSMPATFPVERNQQSVGKCMHRILFRVSQLHPSPLHPSPNLLEQLQCIWSLLYEQGVGG